MKSPNINQQDGKREVSSHGRFQVGSWSTLPSETSRTQGSRGKVGLVPLTQDSGYTVSKVMTEGTFTRSQQRKDNEGLFLPPLSFPCRPPACPGIFPGPSLLCGLEMAPWPLSCLTLLKVPSEHILSPFRVGMSSATHRNTQDTCHLLVRQLTCQWLGTHTWNRYQRRQPSCGS